QPAGETPAVTPPAPVSPAVSSTQSAAQVMPAQWTAPAESRTGPSFLQQVGMQAPPGGMRLAEDTLDVTIQLEPPGPDRVFRRESERLLQERMRQEARNRKPLERITFPDEPVLSTEQYTERMFPPSTEVVEANYVCYGRLYFEDLNSERYGW